MMVGGTGPCRLGYYSIQKEILDLGYEFEMIVLEPPQGKVTDLTDELQKLCGSAGWHQCARRPYRVV